jgi:hypothetical protein
MKRRCFIKYLGVVAVWPFVPVLLSSKKVAAIEVPMKDFEFLEFRQWHINEVVRIYKVPRAHLGVSEHFKKKEGDLR